MIELHSYSWRPGGGTLKRWEYDLSRFVYPRLGMKWVGKVTSADLVACLEPIWHTKPETARQVLSHIRAVMQWAEGKGFRSDDPTRVVSAALGPIRIVVRHMPAVHYSQVSQVLRIIEASNAYWATKAAFRFMTYTAARNGMVRGARWEEIDLASATWTVPGERMKSGRAFTVPLSQAAFALLEQTWQHTAGVGLVFPSPKGRPLSDGTLSKLCRENNVGLRSAWHALLVLSGLVRRNRCTQPYRRTGPRAHAQRTPSNRYPYRPARSKRRWSWRCGPST